MLFYLHTLMILNLTCQILSIIYKTGETAWITGTLSLPIQERGLSYTACVNCQKSLEADTTWIVICPSEIQDMSRITVVIGDGTGFLKANINTPEIEKFIPFTAQDMKIAAENSVPIIAFVRAYEVRVHGATETEMRVNIVKAYRKTDKPSVDTDPRNYRQYFVWRSEYVK
ncbi:hypothetical protein LXL04_034133 [Taraxacum kok-saghyz]